MPHKIAPWRQSVHRNASIALFRSLLLNSRKAGLEDSASDELQSVIRNRFKRSAKEQSKHHLANIFGDGYEALRNLTASAEGDNDARSRLKFLLASASPSLKQPHHPSQFKAAKKPPSAPEVRGPLSSIFNRPRRQVSGIRKIPKLVWASNYPMLRIKKPQPASLSRYFRDRLATNFRWREQILDMDEWQIPIATYEDMWDRILLQDHGNHFSHIRRDWCPEEGWQNELIASKKLLDRRLKDEMKRKVDRARVYKRIIEQETDLWKKERYKRRTARRKVNRAAAAVKLADVPAAPEKRSRGQPRKTKTTDAGIEDAAAETEAKQSIEALTKPAPRRSNARPGSVAPPRNPRKRP